MMRVLILLLLIGSLTWMVGCEASSVTSGGGGSAAGLSDGGGGGGGDGGGVGALPEDPSPDEWGIDRPGSGVVPVPEPSGALIGALGALIVGRVIRRQQRR